MFDYDNGTQDVSEDKKFYLFVPNLDKKKMDKFIYSAMKTSHVIEFSSKTVFQKCGH